MERILIIDDEQRIRRLIPELFESGDYSFESARTGAEGVAQAVENPPDLVITDLMLPGVHGFEVIRRLRANPATARVPILVLSAKVYPPDRRKALDLGADDFLEKPFRIEELTAAVEKRLARIS